MPSDSLSAEELAVLTDFRTELHRRPELSGAEAGTAARVAEFLGATGPDMVLRDLGGHGLALSYHGAAPGPSVLFRAELDALPIPERSGVPHASERDGLGHLCGHDGHMAILAGLARALGRRRPARGRAIVLFQPAEETGRGARAVLADPRFAAIAPDFAFALHNLPGVQLGTARLASGVVNCASRGLLGKEAHAAMPETGRSPLGALVELLPRLAALGDKRFDTDAFATVTVTHARLGVPAFGIAPGAAEIWATLRTRADARMAALVAAAEALVHDAAAAEGLTVSIEQDEIFAACVNATDAVEQLRAGLDAAGIAHSADGLPMRASEDFGLFGGVARSAMVFLGAGETHPALHNPDYDFPDALIPQGLRLFTAVARNLLG